MKEEYKVSTMVFDIGIEYCFYNDDKRFFVIVNGSKFSFKGNEYPVNPMMTKWITAHDILTKLGYSNVKKVKKIGYDLITGVK